MRLAKITFGASAIISYAAVKNAAKKEILSSQNDNLELCHVQVVFRHGARTPLHVPPYIQGVKYEESLLNHSAETIIPYKLVPLHDDKLGESPFEKSYKKRGKLNGGCYPGQLTHVGADQMYKLGLILKDRYVESKFLSPAFQERSNEIFVRSTNIERTIFSARCVLAGMFSDEKGNQAIPIHISDPSKEIMYPNYYSCKYFSTLTRWAWNDPEKLPGIKNIRERIQKTLDIPEEVRVNLVEIFDNLAAGRSHGKTLLDLNQNLVRQIEEGAMQIMYGAFIGIESVRKSSLQLAIGPFVDLLLSNIESICSENQSADTNVKMHLYSGHDTTLIPLLSALGIDQRHWPPYASNVILELFHKEDETNNKNQKYFVKVLYNGEEKKIKGCSSSMCPVNEFQQAVSSVRISEENYHQQCSSEDDGQLRIHRE